MTCHCILDNVADGGIDTHQQPIRFGVFHLPEYGGLGGADVSVLELDPGQTKQSRMVGMVGMSSGWRCHF